jgi:deoxyribonuclease-1
MSRKNKRLQIAFEKKPFININKQMVFLRQNLKKVYEDKHSYFYEKQNQLDINHYYQSVIEHDLDGTECFYKLHHLLDKTHKNRNPYFISKDLYLYTWVDLYPDGTVKCIYSGESRDPRTLILHDYELIVQNREEFSKSFEDIDQQDFELLKQLKIFERRLKLNTEHAVPKSWFGALEPMKGDLHHLFVCNPECNIARSNFPYGEVSIFTPEFELKGQDNHCGTAIHEKFEPKLGKGAIARAMLYFLVRYPRSIKKMFRSTIDIPVLVSWSLNERVTLYEKHRNQAIYHIQGNRNPFIDFPALVNQVEFPV